jgi:hypothetical protein
MNTCCRHGKTRFSPWHSVCSKACMHIKKISSICRRTWFDHGYVVPRRRGRRAAIMAAVMRHYCAPLPRCGLDAARPANRRR